MIYCLYWLNTRNLKQNVRDTGKVKDHIKRMKVVIDDLTFNGKDANFLFDFLARFTTEEDTLKMSEPQAYVSLSHFLSGYALEQYRAVCGSLALDEGGVTNWPVAVQCLLSCYATSNAIHTTNLRLKYIAQKTEQEKMEYSLTLNNAATLRGNVPSVDDKMTLFVDGLQPTMNSSMARPRQRHSHTSYLELVQFD